MDLAGSNRVTIAETYPAEYYAALAFGRGWSKRRPADRAARGPAMLAAAAAIGAAVAPAVEALMIDGFGGRPDGEDPFDATVGLVGMLIALRDGAPLPDGADARSVEGWILGLSV